MLKRLVALIIAPLVLAGCAIGNKHNYRDVVATLPSANSQNIAVATHDNRPYVLSNDKPPSFVGLQRGGYGNPFDVENANGEALSSSFSAAVCGSFTSAGGQCSVVTTTPSERIDGIKQRLENQGAQRAILFTLREWKSDTMMNTALHYDVTMDVISPSGTILLTKRINGVDDLRGSFWNAPGYAKKAVPTAFKKKLEDLLGNEEVIAALRAKGTKTVKIAMSEKAPQETVHAPSQSSCSVSQILEMQKLGLSEAQIQRSCQ